MNDNQVLTELFSQKLDTGEGKTKVAAYSGNYIRDRLREINYTSKVIPAEPVTRKDCQVSVNHDTLIKIVNVEPQSRAMSVSFRGQPDARFVSAPRAEVPFFTISSEKFEKTEQELLAYDMPITKIIEDNSVKDMDEIVDREFTIHIESAVQALQAEANGVGSAPILSASSLQGGSPPVEFSVRKGELARSATSNTATSLPIQRPDLVNLFKLLDGNRLRCELILITEVDYDDVLQWTVEDFGDKIQSETTVDGYKYNTLLGRSYVRTIKTDILRAGNVYAFTKPEFFGKYYVLNKAKFYIDKIANLITWQSWMDIALSIVNIASVRKLELYSADATANDDDSLLDSLIPVEEEELGAVNNRVEDGLHYPQVEQF
jgi:hypothetical protein